MAPKKKETVRKALFTKDNIEAQINKKYGDRVQVGGLAAAKDVVSTGSLSMDIASGVGGIPRGRIIEISGMPSAGKTYRSLMIAKNIQKLGGNIAFIDTEYATDPEYIQSLGIDVSPDRWRVFYPENLETAGDLCADLCESGLYTCVIFDSVGGAPFAAQQEGDTGDATVMVRARLMSTIMPKINGPVYRNGIFMIFTNQLRNTMDKYNPYIAPGGNALPFHASMRIFLTSKKGEDEVADKDNDVEYVTIKGDFKKNKCAPPFRKFEYDMDFSSLESDYVMEMASILTTPKYCARMGITRGGAWYTLPANLVALGLPEKINGAAKFKEALTKELNETGSMEVIDAVDKFIRSALIKNYNPDYVMDLTASSYEAPEEELYEGSEE